MNSRLNSVTAYITLAAIVIHIILTPILFVSVISYVKTGYQQQFIDNTRSSTSLITSQLSQFDFNDEKDKIESILDEILLSGQVSFIEIDIDVNTTVSSFYNLLDRKEFKEDFSFAQNNDHIYFIKMNFQSVINEKLVLHIGFDELLIQEQIQSSVERGVWIAIGYFFITVCSILIFVPKLTRPIKFLRNSVQQVANGNSNQSFELNTSIVEFSSLGKDLEIMRSELIKQTKAIQYRESYIRAIMEKMADPMIILNKNFVIESTNTAANKILGYSEHELLDHDFFSIFAKEEGRNLKSEVVQVVNAGTEDIVHCAGLTKQSGIFPMDLSFSKIYVSDHEIIICNFHDMSEYKKTEDNLIEAREIAETANKAKSIFLSSMSHELRTPLNAIIGYSEILLEDAIDDGDKSTENDLLKIRSSGKHLLSLINNILDLSKIEAGKMELDIQKIVVNTMLEDVIISTRPLIEKNGNNLVIENNSNQTSISSDITKIKQILINLLGNAAKFTEKGRITLSISDCAIQKIAYLQFEIIDTGVGISQDDQKNLFKDFGQANKKIATKYGGTGLGLALSSKFCHMMNGTINFQSELGVGTTFTVLIPLEYNNQMENVS